ncbi:hypothetical protein BX661DRAFT_224202 [Kickxella alabastrina]|uniref:uncharacterized protein n=1 Tax=Kickxella alabastrina TaxID=61397 RepID=UPI002220113E|nr:uncharacterized protein BX661DRAFT_224202 [Kickxella alabastrina]KAI7829225.1 hypothetical protein BX661DRAFT_224202 [Kickxella alabastrina]
MGLIHFVKGRIVDDRIIDPPDYYFSLSTRQTIGFWAFNTSDKLPSTESAQETTLFTLLDDVTADLALRLVFISANAKDFIAFTMSLNVTRKGSSPAVKLFYFENQIIKISERIIVIECPLYDAETAKLVLVAQIDTPDVQTLSSTDLRGLVFIHGGVLATVLNNASTLLLTKVAGIDIAHVNTVARDVRYLKGIYLNSKGVVIDAVVEEANDKDELVIFPKLMKGADVHTTLRITFTLPKPDSKL